MKSLTLGIADASIALRSLNRDFVEAFDGLLTQKQVRTLIESLCGDHLLAQHGNARATRYVWSEGAT